MKTFSDSFFRRLFEDEKRNWNLFPDHTFFFVKLHKLAKCYFKGLCLLPKLFIKFLYLLSCLGM